VNNARTSEQLLALAGAAGVSMLADATFFSPDSPPASFDEDNTLRGLVLEIGYQEHLSSRLLDDGTLLALLHESAVVRFWIE